MAELRNLKTAEGKPIDADDAGNRTILENLRQRVQSQIYGASYADPMNELINSFEAALEYQRRLFEELGYSEVYDIAAQDLSRLVIASQMPLTELGGAKQVVTTEIRGAFDDALFGRSTLSDLSNVVDAKLNKLNAWGYTIASTGVSGFDRTATAEFADELGIEYFQYFGVKDKKNRDFCAAILAGRHPNTGEPHKNYWHKDEIETLDNGHRLNVRTYGGGYNCRHVWQPVPNRR